MVEKNLQEILNEINEEVNQNSNEAIDKATEILEKKYNCEMIAKKIGNRFNTGNTTLVFYSETYPDVLFSAILDNDTKELKDDYVYRVMTSKTEKIIEETFKREKISTAIKVLFVAESLSEQSELELSVEQYIKTYEIKSIYIYIAFNSNELHDNSAIKIIDILKQISSNLGISIVINCFVIGEEFEKCKKELSNNLNITKSWFINYKPEISFNFSVYGEEKTDNVDGFIKFLKGVE